MAKPPECQLCDEDFERFSMVRAMGVRLERCGKKAKGYSICYLPKGHKGRCGGCQGGYKDRGCIAQQGLPSLDNWDEKNEAFCQ